MCIFDSVYIHVYAFIYMHVYAYIHVLRARYNGCRCIHVLVLVYWSFFPPSLQKNCFPCTISNRRRVGALQLQINPIKSTFRYSRVHVYSFKFQAAYIFMQAIYIHAGIILWGSSCEHCSMTRGSFAGHVYMTLYIHAPRPKPHSLVVPMKYCYLHIKNCSWHLLSTDLNIYIFTTPEL